MMGCLAVLLFFAAVGAFFVGAVGPGIALLLLAFVFGAFDS